MHASEQIYYAYVRKARSFAAQGKHEEAVQCYAVARLAKIDCDVLGIELCM